MAKNNSLKKQKMALQTEVSNNRETSVAMTNKAEVIVLKKTAEIWKNVIQSKLSLRYEYVI